MDVIVISSKDKFRSEIPHVVQMMEKGLAIFHLRKPKFSQQMMEDYINQIPEKYHKRVVIHSFHDLIKKYNLRGIHLTKRHKKDSFKTSLRNFWFRLIKRDLKISTSCHDLLKLGTYIRKYDYVFLSPVYDSISKSGRNAGYPYGTIKKILGGLDGDVYALGGIDVSKIEEAKDLGFTGVALLGTLWHSGKNPTEQYIKIVETANGKNLFKPIETEPVKVSI